MNACIRNIGCGFFGRECAAGPRPHISPDPLHPLTIRESTPAHAGSCKIKRTRDYILCPACSIEYASDALLATLAAPKKPSALDEPKEFVQEALKNRALLSTRLEEEALRAGISRGTLRRAKEALGITAKKSGKGRWWSILSDTLTEEEGASEEDHQDDRMTQDEHLEHLEHLGAEEQLAEGEDAQGVQDAQGNHAPEYEQLAKCIHDVPGGW
jgi:hypothetical protein